PSKVATVGMIPKRLGFINDRLELRLSIWILNLSILFSAPFRRTLGICVALAGLCLAVHGRLDPVAPALMLARDTPWGGGAAWLGSSTDGCWPARLRWLGLRCSRDPRSP